VNDVRRLVLLLLLAGCAGNLERATDDETQLKGKVPQQLGRELRVELTGADEPMRETFLSALRSEFEGRDLFDRVRLGQGKTTAGATLSIVVVERDVDDLFDLWEFTDAYVVRYELEIDLLDPRKNHVLAGHITGIGVDAVSDDDDIDEQAQADIDLAAVSDAASKISRNLRLAADRRGIEALDAMPEVVLPAGVGPLSVAVLGVTADDNRVGHEARARLGVALAQLGSDVFLVPGPNVDRALEDLMPGSLEQPDPAKLEDVAAKLRARYLVIGQLRRGAERVELEVRLFDAEGALLTTARGSALGLGAPQVAACEVAKQLGAHVLTVHSPKSDNGRSSR